jgi:hypothetical protein
MPLIQCDGADIVPTSLEFQRSDYTEFHPYAKAPPSELNGTSSTQVIIALQSPRTTMTTFRNSLGTRTSTLRWPALRRLAEDATFKAEARINRAFADQ